MNSKLNKCCAVPQCDNTLNKTPNKLFVYGPHLKAMRNKWFNLAQRDPTAISPKSIMYFCEDHFDFTNKPTSKVQAQSSKGLDFTDDPFRDYRYEDPFNFTFDDEPASNVAKDAPSPADKNKFDPFGLGGRQSVPLPSSDPFFSSSGRASAPIPSQVFSEHQQLEWAALESLRLEEDRKRRQLQEQADLELAISLSKAESKQI